MTYCKFHLKSSKVETCDFYGEEMYGYEHMVTHDLWL